MALRKYIYYLFPLWIIRFIIDNMMCNYPIYSKNGHYYNGIKVSDKLIIIKLIK